VRTTPLASRRHLVHLPDLARVGEPGISFAEFVANLPRQLAADTFRELVAAIAAAHRLGKPVIWGMGAHVIKVGLSPWVIAMMRRGIVTAVALNGGGSIHDIELALAGETSEDVAEGLPEGSFGLSEDTGQVYFDALADIEGTGDSDAGLGERLGRQLLEREAPHRQHSILVAGVELDVPVTVHLAIGTDVVHMHPRADGAALGAATFHDFRLLTALVSELGDGGVYCNIGSAVLLPEVFLKCLTVARNLGRPVTGFTTANLDMLQQYRPLTNVVHRPTAGHGRGLSLIGHHELLVPMLAQAVIEALA